MEGGTGTRHPLVELARRTIETYVREGRSLPGPETGEGADRRAGVFVSLKKRGELRGCIGTFLPTARNVASEVVQNAIAAAVRDPRFPPLAPEELPGLEISVDELAPPEPVTGMHQLDPVRFGIILRSGRKTGLLLPDLPGVETVEQQVGITMRKAGILPGEPLEILRFEVKRYR